MAFGEHIPFARHCRSIDLAEREAKDDLNVTLTAAFVCKSIAAKPAPKLPFPCASGKLKVLVGLS
jgi:hypothetical protein